MTYKLYTYISNLLKQMMLHIDVTEAIELIEAVEVIEAFQDMDDI